MSSAVVPALVWVDRDGARPARLLMEGLDLGDDEAPSRQQVGGRPGQLAPAEEPLQQRIEAPLPAPNPLIRSQPVLEEMLVGGCL
jgi:hypothetical protein